MENARSLVKFNVPSYGCCPYGSPETPEEIGRPVRGSSGESDVISLLSFFSYLNELDGQERKKEKKKSQKSTSAVPPLKASIHGRRNRVAGTASFSFIRQRGAARGSLALAELHRSPNRVERDRCGTFRVARHVNAVGAPVKFKQSLSGLEHNCRGREITISGGRNHRRARQD